MLGCALRDEQDANNDEGEEDERRKQAAEVQAALGDRFIQKGSSALPVLSFRLEIAQHTETVKQVATLLLILGEVSRKGDGI